MKLFGNKAEDKEVTESEETPSPAAPERPRSWDSLVSEGMQSYLQADVEGEDEEQPPSDYEDEDEEEEEEYSPEEDDSIGDEGTPAPASQVTSVDQWVDVIREKPVRINEVPAKNRAAVLEAILKNEEQAYIIALQRTAQQVEAQVRAQIAAEADFAEIEQVRAEDPESFRDWEDANPEKAEAFRQYRAWKAKQGKQPQQGNDVESLRTIARGLLEKLPPDQLQNFLGRPNDYPATVAGIQKLQNDVLVALSQPKPEDKESKRRENAASGRSGLPRPDASKGVPVGASVPDPLANETDPIKLITIGLQRQMREHPTRKAVKRANSK